MTFTSPFQAILGLFGLTLRPPQQPEIGNFETHLYLPGPGSGKTHHPRAQHETSTLLSGALRAHLDTEESRDNRSTQERYENQERRH